MKLNENDYQPLGFLALNGPELYDLVGEQYGMLSVLSNQPV
jgi:hypothetical protein